MAPIILHITRNPQTYPSSRNPDAPNYQMPYPPYTMARLYFYTQFTGRMRVNECGSSSNLVLEIFGLLGVGPANDGHAARHSERSHHAHIGDGGEVGRRRDGGRGSGENGHGGDHGESCHLVCNDLVAGILRTEIDLSARGRGRGRWRANW